MRYVYDGNNVWADLYSDNSLQSHYIHGQGTDNLLARVSVWMENGNKHRSRARLAFTA